MFISVCSGHGSRGQAPDHLGCKTRGGVPGYRLAVEVVLAQRDCRDAEQGGFHRRRDGPGIGQILSDIAAGVDPRQHEVRAADRATGA